MDCFGLNQSNINTKSNIQNIRVVLSKVTGIISLLFFPFLLSAQKQRCNSPYNDIQITTEARAESRTNKTMQVVFHILFRTEEENITFEEIQQQLERVNEDFNAVNEDLSLVPDEFQEFIGDANMKFVIATTDAVGLPFTGIFRRQTTIDTIGNQFSVDGKEVIKYDILGGLNAYFPDLYINVWVGQTKDIFGITSPLDVAGSRDDGIIITPEAFGLQDDPESPTSLGRTLTHELGHYFGLNHLWGSQRSCNNDDEIEDTPVQESPYIDCPEFPQVTCGSADMHMNFMDFTNDECLLFFTKGQVEVMRMILEEIRFGTIVSTEDDLVFTEPFEFNVNQSRFGLTIKSDNTIAESLQISVFNLSGQLIHRELLNEVNVYQINTNSWPRSVYILAIDAVDQRFTHTFIAGY